MVCYSIRHKWWIVVFLAAFASGEMDGYSQEAFDFGASSQILAQEESQGRKAKKRRTRKRRKRKIKPSSDISSSLSSYWFPPWLPYRMIFSLQPILGAGVSSDSVGGVNTTRVMSEFGAAIGVNAISLVSGNPGLYVSPEIAYAVGTDNRETEVDGNKTEEDSSFTRRLIGADFHILYYFYRHILGIKFGKLEYSGDLDDEVNTFSLYNDFGFLILPFLSAHLSLDYLTIYESKMSDPMHEEKDHWVHASVFFEFLNSNLDFGPGFTMIDVYSKTNNEWNKVTSGQSDYFLAKGRMDLFWKLYFSASAKYVYNAPKEYNGDIAKMHLPVSDVSDPKAYTTIPEDSMEYDIFIGGHNLIGGLGFGWKYHEMIFNYNEKDGKERSSKKDQGYTVSYTLAL